MHRFSSTSKKYFSHRGRILEADLLCTSLPRGQECKQSVGVKWTGEIKYIWTEHTLAPPALASGGDCRDGGRLHHFNHKNFQIISMVIINQSGITRWSLFTFSSYQGRGDDCCGIPFLPGGVLLPVLRVVAVHCDQEEEQECRHYRPVSLARWVAASPHWSHYAECNILYHLL